MKFQGQINAQIKTHPANELQQLPTYATRLADERIVQQVCLGKECTFELLRAISQIDSLAQRCEQALATLQGLKDKLVAAGAPEDAIELLPKAQTSTTSPEKTLEEEKPTPKETQEEEVVTGKEENILNVKKYSFFSSNVQLL